MTTALKTEDEAYAAAISAYEEIVQGHPGVQHEPGLVAERIQQQTGVDFEIAAIVALSGVC